MSKNKRQGRARRSYEKKKEIRNKVLVTLGYIVLFRLLTFIPVPFVDTDLWKEVGGYTFLTFMDVFTGGISAMTLMAIGVSAYITASIIIQMLSFMYRPLAELSKTPSGERVMKRYILLLSVVIAAITSSILVYRTQVDYNVMSNTAWYAYTAIVLSHVFGTVLAVRIGEDITKKGFGNGLSILIAINIMSSFPFIVKNVWGEYVAKLMSLQTMILAGVLVLVLLLFTTIIESSERKIPVQYSKSAIRGAQTAVGAPKNSRSYLPIKFNLNGVMPLIMATALVQLVVLVATLFAKKSTLATMLVNVLAKETVVYFIVVAVLIFASSFLYSFMSFDAREVSDNLQKNGGTVVGVQPGDRTVGYLRKTNINLTFWSSLALALVSLIPMVLFARMNIQGLAATSFMIIASVLIETWTQYKNEKKLVR